MHQLSSTVQVWEVATQRPVASLRHEGNVYAIDLSPDGKLVVMAGTERTVQLWAWGEAGREPTVLSIEAARQSGTAKVDHPPPPVGQSSCQGNQTWEHGTGPRSLFATTFSPDGQLIATGGGDCLVRVWDTATGQLRSVLAGHTAEVTRLVFSPDGTYLVSASGLPGGGFDPVPWVWDVNAWQGYPLQGENGHDRIYGVAVSPNSQFVATASGDNVVRVWNARTHKPWATLLGHAHWVGSAAFSPVESHMLVTTGGEDRTARIWDIGTSPGQGRPLFVLRGHTEAIGSAVFSPKSSQLVTTSLHETALLWDLNLEDPFERLPVDLALKQDDESVSPDHRFTLRLDDTKVSVHDNVNNRDLPPLQGHLQRVLSAEFSHDGKLIVTAGGDDNTARIWDASSHETLTILQEHSAAVLSAKFDQTGMFVVTAGADGTVRVWDVATGQLLHQYEADPGPWSALAFTPDGQLLACSRTDDTFSADGTLFLWNTRTGERVRSLRGAACQPFFSPDGNTVSAWAKNKVHVWNTATGIELRQFSAAYVANRCPIAFAPNGKWVACGQFDGYPPGHFFRAPYDCLRHSLCTQR